MGTKEYNYDTFWLRLSDKTAHRVRGKFFKFFMEIMNPQPEDKVLDLGVTCDAKRDSSNYFEKLYPWTKNITAVGLEDGSYLEQKYLGLKFVRADGTALPFQDNTFDIVFSAAVAEHVGSFENQRKFYNEALRVGKKVFITTPDRFFPVEVHTGIPFLHYLPKNIFRAILRRIGMSDLADEKALNLLSYGDIKKIIEGQEDAKIIRKFNSLLVVKIR